MLGRQNERNISYIKLAHTSIFGLCFMPVCLMKSNCYTLIYSSLVGWEDHKAVATSCIIFLWIETDLDACLLMSENREMV